MAHRRRVIADSDDEDGDDDQPLSPLREEASPPETEPLSPHHRPSSPTSSKSHNQISDVTNPSFFDGVFNDHRTRALEQSQLIENIVRQSQKASASSGDVSLPAKGKGRKLDPSSGTDVTSPVVLRKPKNQPAPFSDGASEFTTPRKSTGDEWDVPSSAEGATATKSVKSSRSKEKTYGKRQRRISKLAPSSSDAGIGAPEAVEPEHMAEDVAAQDELPLEDNDVGPSPLPSAKKREISLHDTVLQDTAKFYIAPSNMTTMQKLEYQRVNVPPGSLANQKSSGTSGVTTIAYSTPSAYASSGPPIPWDRPSVADTQPPTPREVIDITSSPDVMASGHGCAKRRKVIASPTVDTPVADSRAEPANGSPDPIPVKTNNKKRPKDMEDIDELGQDDSWDSDTIGYYRESYRPRTSRRRSKASISIILEDEVGEQTGFPTPYEEVHNKPADELAEIAPADPEPPAAPESPATKADQAEDQPTVQPKKRGRKKKQPVVEVLPQDVPDTGLQVVAQEPPPLGTALEVEAPVEKPKKKRGRPRKSDFSKAEVVAPEPPVAETVAAPGTSTIFESKEGEVDELAAEQFEEDIEEPNAKRRKKSRKETRNTEASTPSISAESLPLKELDRNSRSPSKLHPSDALAAKSVTPATDENLPTKSQAKETPKSTPTASQSKALYRVGLSKRSRIAPLLKIIKK
ncbi:Uu.00g073950.m01.CDS01 [Anthostomella pinea]|uniref:Uu.00g073950.m01.CDS01 n=1 Tax=Anthostomella pinea TaxID=933095 RepID=A0AAI8VW01_9PEZI|nr:Uu.00g073950.m01.CDS01 [Anthostomella pinea]